MWVRLWVGWKHYINILYILYYINLSTVRGIPLLESCHWNRFPQLEDLPPPPLPPTAVKFWIFHHLLSQLTIVTGKDELRHVQILVWTLLSYPSLRIANHKAFLALQPWNRQGACIWVEIHCPYTWFGQRWAILLQQNYTMTGSSYWQLSHIFLSALFLHTFSSKSAVNYVSDFRDAQLRWESN